MALETEGSGIGTPEINRLTPRDVYLLAKWFGLGLLIAAGLSACGETPEDEELLSVNSNPGECTDISDDSRTELLVDLEPSILAKLQTTLDLVSAGPGDPITEFEPELDIPEGLEIDSLKAIIIDKGGFSVECFSVVFEEPNKQSLDDAIAGVPNVGVENPFVLYRFGCSIGTMVGFEAEVDGQTGRLSARVFDQLVGLDPLDMSIFLESGDDEEGVFVFQLGTEPDDPLVVGASTVREFLDLLRGVVECTFDQL